MMNGAQEESVLASRKVISKNRRFRDHVTTPAAVVSLLLMIGYTVFVMRFAVNVPVSDEWFFSVGIVNSAIHHTLSLPQLWTPWLDGHLFIPGVLLWILGPITHLNFRVFIFLNSLLYCISFVVVMTLVRITAKPPIKLQHVLCLGLAWFSLSGIDNALWAFMNQIYLVLLFIPLMILLLNRAMTRDQASFVLLTCSVACAVGASLSCMQGMIAWPVGLLVLLWTPNHVKQRRRSVSVWLISATLMTLLFLVGYNAGHNACVADAASCSPAYSLHHPVAALSYFSTLIGNIIPTTTSALWSGANQYQIIHQHLGELILVAAICVVVYSFKYRSAISASFLAPAFIVTGLIWDILITIARVGIGQRTALQSHYNTPQVLILIGIIIGTFSFLTLASNDQTESRFRLSKRKTMRPMLTLSVVLFLLIIALGDVIGFQNAQRSHSTNAYSAQVLANLNQVPSQKRGCFINIVAGYGLYTPLQAEVKYGKTIRILKNDQLSIFYSPVYNSYRHQGLPLFPYC